MRNLFRITIASLRNKFRTTNSLPITMADFYQRTLPHWHPEGQIYFITFRLVNSLPASLVQELENERERARQIIRANFDGLQQRVELYLLDKKYFGHFDTWLDRCLEESPRWLAEENVVRIVAEQVHALDGERYRLEAYCIMSNHVHLAVGSAGHEVRPTHRGVTAPYPLADTLKRLKGRTARFCNQALGRSGSFWHPESYDHVVRDQKEYERIIGYILNNPVKAGLVEKWEEWKFSYIRPVSRN